MSKYKVGSYVLICHVYTCIYTTLVNKQNNANLYTISEARDDLNNYMMTYFKAEVQRTVEKYKLIQTYLGSAQLALKIPKIFS